MFAVYFPFFLFPPPPFFFLSQNKNLLDPKQILLLWAGFSLLSVTSTELRRSNFSLLYGLCRSWSRSVRSRECQRGGQTAWWTKMLHGVARSSASPVLNWLHRLVPLLLPSLQPPRFSFSSMLSRRGSANAELYLGEGRDDVWLRLPAAGGHCHLPTAGSARSARHRCPGMDAARRAAGMACLGTRGGLSSFWFQGGFGYLSAGSSQSPSRGAEVALEVAQGI